MNQKPALTIMGQVIGDTNILNLARERRARERIRRNEQLIKSLCLMSEAIAPSPFRPRLERARRIYRLGGVIKALCFLSSMFVTVVLIYLFFKFVG